MRRVAWAALLVAGCRAAREQPPRSPAAARVEVAAVDAGVVDAAPPDDGGAAPWRLSELPTRVDTPAAAGEVRDAVLWFTHRLNNDGDEAVGGVWFAHAVDGSVRRVELPRAVFAWGAAAWAWRVTARTQPLEPCSDYDEHGEPIVDPEAAPRVCTHADVDLVPLAGGAPRVAFAGDCGGLDRGDSRQELRLVGQLGPWLLVDFQGSSYACGAHGDWTARQHALDLRGGALRPVDQATPGPLGAAVERAADAFLRNRLRNHDDPIGEIVHADEERRPVGRFDAFTPCIAESGVAWMAVVGAETCYMCTPHGRHSYWTDVDIPLPPAAALDSWAAPPPEWAAELRRQPTPAAAGWSTFVGTVAARDLALQRARSSSP